MSVNGYNYAYVIMFIIFRIILCIRSYCPGSGTRALCGGGRYGSVYRNSVLNCNGQCSAGKVLYKFHNERTIGYDDT